MYVGLYITTVLSPWIYILPCINLLDFHFPCSNIYGYSLQVKPFPLHLPLGHCFLEWVQRSCSLHRQCSKSPCNHNFSVASRIFFILKTFFVEEKNPENELSGKQNSGINLEDFPVE